MRRFGSTSGLLTIALLGALGVTAFAAPAHAWWRGGVFIGVPVAPPPVYYAPPPPVVYAPPPAYAYPRVWVPAHWNGWRWIPGNWA